MEKMFLQMRISRGDETGSYHRLDHGKEERVATVERQKKVRELRTLGDKGWKTFMRFWKTERKTRVEAC